MFTILPHTADVRLKVSALTQEELFRSALEGMAEIQRPGFCKQVEKPWTIREEIAIQSRDMTSLLIDFLSAVLTFSHIDKAMFCEIHFEALTETTLNAFVEGRPMDDVEEDIKAVTYHEAHVSRQENGGLETIIVFDI